LFSFVPRLWVRKPLSQQRRLSNEHVDSLWRHRLSESKHGGEGAQPDTHYTCSTEPQYSSTTVLVATLRNWSCSRSSTTCSNGIGLRLRWASANRQQHYEYFVCSTSTVRSSPPHSSRGLLNTSMIHLHFHSIHYILLLLKYVHQPFRASVGYFHFQYSHIVYFAPIIYFVPCLLYKYIRYFKLI